MSAEDFEQELNGGKPKKSKDFWLFLIFVDIVAMVFFGFLIYQFVSAKFNAAAAKRNGVPDMQIAAKIPSPQMPPQVITTEPAMDEPAPAGRPQDFTPVPPPAAAPVPKPAQVPQAPVIQPSPQPKIEKRQSVFIEPAGAKTRKVTFKYFGAAKTAGIVSGFTMTKPQPLKKIDGAWQGTFVIYPGEYKYLFIIDGVKTLDPNAPEADGRSVVTIP